MGNKYLFGRICVAVLCIFFFVNFVQNTIKTYKNDYYDPGGTQKIKGRVEAIEYIFNDAGEKPFNLLIFAPPVYTYPYDFLIWRLGTTKYNYMPTNKKEGTYYLLIEPDPSKPWSYKGWLETVIKPNEPLWEKILNSGFIIQKTQRLITASFFSYLIC